MKPEELEKSSDFVGTIRVLAVTRIGSTRHASTGEELPVYQAWVQVVETKKGKSAPGETMIVQWQEIPKKLVGPWRVPYYAGEIVTTHLRLDASGRTYTTTWWNAKGSPTRQGNPDMPARTGEVIVAK